MLKRIFWAVLTCCFVTAAFAQKTYVSKADKLPNHPRLLMLKGEEKVVMQQVKKDPYWKVMQANLVEECDRILELPLLERKQIGRRLLSVSQEALRRVFYLGYAYRTTGQKKYALRAEQDMLACAAFSDWNPSHFLDVGEMTMALAIGYDWLYQLLPESSRTAIRTAIIEKGMKASLNDNDAWFHRAAHNWNQVCNAGITFGALAVYEDATDFSLELINKALNTIRPAMHEYAPDGAYPEGPGYWGYGTTFNVFFNAAIEKAYGKDFGLNAEKGFLETGLYSQHIITPGYNQFNYSDNGYRAGFSPIIFWFYSKTHDPALLYMQKGLYEQTDKSSYLRNRILPMALIFGAGSKASLAAAAEPTSIFWKGGGRTPVVFMRGAWTSGSSFLGFKAGTPSANHGHMDVGSFIFEADNVRWALDLGGENYNSLETKGVDLWNMKQNSQRWDVYRYCTTSHNTLSFNDKPQLVAGKAPMLDAGEKDNYMYAVSDLSPVYADQIPGVKRAVSLVNKDYAVIQDLYTTGNRFTKAGWHMVTEASKITILSENTALLESGDKKLYVKIESPVPVRLYVRPYAATNTYDNKPAHNAQFLCYDADLERNKTQEIRVYLMPREMKANPVAPYKF